jgi:hypothetical protein
MGVRAENSTNYSHSDEPNLLNLHKAMEYNSAGQPIIRTTLGGSNSAAVDAFGRLRVSQPFTLFDSFNRYQDSKFNSLTATSGTVSHDADSSTVSLNVTNASGSKVYRESNKVFAYQPGKSLQILTTFCMATAKANLRQRVGYFDAADGIFLEQDGTSVYLVKRTSASGSLSEVRVAQANWNVNSLTGSGVNPDILDLSRVQIFFIDIEWLGVGSVRCGFVIDSQFVVVHQFNHANVSGNTSVYMGTACLPIRYEIENTAGTSGSSILKQICSTVISEGGYELTGRSRAAGTLLASPRTISSGDGYVPIISMRLKSNRLGGIVLPKSFTIAVSGNVNYEWRIIVGGTTSGGAGTYTDAGATDSSVEYILDRTSISNGNIEEKGYIINSNQSSFSPQQAEFFKYQLERNTFTTSATALTIAVASSGTNNSVWASIDWQEMT